MELWDIYDADKKPTGRTMKRNDWCLKDGEYHLTVLGVVARPDQTFLITKRVMTRHGHRAGGKYPAAQHRLARSLTRQSFAK